MMLGGTLSATGHYAQSGHIFLPLGADCRGIEKYEGPTARRIVQNSAGGGFRGGGLRHELVVAASGPGGNHLPDQRLKSSATRFIRKSKSQLTFKRA
jgi:hypothetical protein